MLTNSETEGIAAGGAMSSGADSGGGGSGGSGFGYLNFNRVRYNANPPPRRYESIEVDDEDDDNENVADAEDEIMGLVGASLPRKPNSGHFQ